MPELTIFEKIIKGEIPSTKVYEDNDVLAFLDIQPNNFGHTLVVPKVAYKNIYELPDDILAKVFVVAKKVAIALKEGLGADGVHLAMNNDPAAAQEVFHAHVHVIPRSEGDSDEQFVYGRHLEYRDNEHMEEVADKIRKEL